MTYPLTRAVRCHLILALALRAVLLVAVLIILVLFVLVVLCTVVELCGALTRLIANRSDLALLLRGLSGPADDEMRPHA